MFRRREDSLFETNEPNQPEETSETAAPASAAASGAQSAPPTPPGQGTSRYTPESRPASNTTAGGAFRTTANPLPSDMTRSRMPEAKTSITPSTSPITSVEKPGKTIRRVLTVGSDILLKGEIATCDRLVIEGKVDATLNDVHTVEITESGSFKGSAQIEDAEISGLFEGDLIVRGRLVIYSSGKVRGKISYGEIEIERGGELSGEIKSSAQSAQTVGTPARNKVAA